MTHPPLRRVRPPAYSGRREAYLPIVTTGTKPP